ncbi:MAG: hypothetical protein MUP98_01395 [Candidatus Aminicenantes bacterium]|nr:hypothetical protein [Candidatus Aminicenantes bacterium]
MKGKIFVLIFLLNFTFSLTVNAQWAKTYGGSRDDRPNSFQLTSDGGVIVFGSSESFGSNIWILKLDLAGDIEWQKTYGDQFNTYLLPNTYSIQNTNDGGYIFGGSISPSGLSHQFWMVKLSANGNILWQKSYGDNDLNYVYSLQQTQDGGYIVLGNTGIQDAAGFDFILLKLSFNGTMEWSKAYLGRLGDTPSSVLPTIDGGYVVAGSTFSYGAGSSDIWILKLASDGIIEWQKTYGGSESESAFSIQKTNDGGYIVAGAIASFGAGQSDFWILKISSDGDMEWNKAYGGSQEDVAYSIQQTTDGGYIAAGQTLSFGAGKSDIWILKLTSEGNIEWQKTCGGRQDEQASAIQQTSDGGYFVTGSTDSYGAGEQDLFLIKLFANGDFDSSCGLINDSNAQVSGTGINSTDSNLDPEDTAFISSATYAAPKESEAVVYSLCAEGQHILSLTASSGGTTEPSPGTYIYNHAERISMSFSIDDGSSFIGWSGDVASSDKFLSITMDSDKSIKANFIENVLEDIWEEVKKAPCFIATATFGSPFHPYVITLQDFRDKYLMSSRSGRKLVNLYYKYSPPIADLITHHKVLRTVVRFWLLPMVAVGYSMVHFGPVKTAMMFILSIMPLFCFVWFYRRKSKKDKP